MPQETYSLLSLDDDIDDQRDESTLYAPFENMLSAAREVVASLCPPEDSSPEALNFLSREYAILGGLSMQLRGGRRSTRDIDLVTSIKMKGVWEAITGNERIVIPDSRLIEGVIKVFVKTGAPWDACGEAHRIEVDIMQAGFRGSPRKLKGHVEALGPFDLFGEKLHFNVVDVALMMRIKVECCLGREEPRDFEDVKFMIVSYPSQVRAALSAGVLEEEDLLEVLEHGAIGDEDERLKLRETVFPQADEPH